MRIPSLPLNSPALLCRHLVTSFVTQISSKIAQFILLLALVLTSGQLFAATLSGVVYGGSQLLENAVVTLLDASQQPIDGIPAASTDAAGAYQFTIPADGNYYLTVSPPAGSGYGSVSATAVPVSASDVQQDFFLVAGAVTLSGVVRDHTGAAVASAYIGLYQQVAGEWLQIGQEILVGSDGRYEWAVTPGDYYLASRIYNNSTNLNGAATWVYRYSADFTVSSNTDRDLVYDFVVLSGRTLDGNGAAVADVELRMAEPRYWNGPESGANKPSYRYQYYHTTDASLSDSNGNYQLLLFPTDSCITSGSKANDVDCLYDITITPPQATGLSTTYLLDYAITADTSRDITLSAGYNLSGIIRDHTGSPISGARVTLYQQVGTSWLQVGQELIVSNDGAYSWLVDGGNYYLAARLYNYSDTLRGAPTWSYKYTVDFAVTADRVKDLTYDFVVLSGRTLDGNGDPVAGTKVKISEYKQWYGPEQGSAGRNSYRYLNFQDSGATLSDSAGNYQLLLFPTDSCIASGYANCLYDISVTPPQASGLALTSLLDYAISADSSHDFILGAGYSLSGVVRNHLGEPIPNSYLNLYKLEGSSWLQATPEVNTGADGSYQWLVEAGSYYLDGKGYNTSGNLTGAPTWTYKHSADFSVNADSVEDLVYDFVVLSGRTVDSNGVAVPNVDLKIAEGKNWYGPEQGSAGHKAYRYLYNSPNDATPSDANGDYQLLMFSTDSCIDSGYRSNSDDYCLYDLSIAPPLASGFSQLAVPKYAISNDKFAQIVLTFVDTTAPLILSGPYATNLSDNSALIQWQTNEPASSEVSGDVTVIQTGYRTVHSVLLENLTAATRYTLSVFSADEAGNGPATGGPISFTTLATPDTAAPVIIAGPMVTKLSDSSATIEWQTNEPADGKLDFGLGSLSQSLSHADLTTLHKIELTGLDPSTRYVYRVSSSDLAGNGPTQSPVLDFKTLAVPDITAPLVIRGPMVINVTDTGMTLLWSTDEPANSGLSYNDGITYEVMNDASLTYEHSIRLTGLTPATTYALTVSASDALGNGPTLSEPVSVTTLQTPDTTPPQFVTAPAFCNVNHQLIRLCWETDEPSSALVRYSTDETELNLAETRTQLISHHSIPITGLASNTLYYLQVVTRDTEGNEAISEVLSVKTDALPDTSPPAFTKQGKASYISNDKVVIEWETDKPADGVVDCDSATHSIRGNAPEKRGKQSVTLTNLQPNTTYNCQIRVIGTNGQSATATLGGQ